MKLLKNRKRILGNKRIGVLSNLIYDEYDQKLTKLSMSCEMSKSELTEQLLQIALDSPNVVEWLQDKYNKVEEYRVRPLKINNKIHY
ncbi:hypothetical protein R4Z10_12525 [Niallia sp. XMNu-256]|uniref:hypothetical protein n=1 Tax=Niallia sp. XMNu-256 TaxID=3082444 RepID=UPI0030CF5E00